MDQENVLEYLFLLLALIYFTIRWIYRRIRTSPSSPRSATPVRNIASPRPTFTGPTSRRLPRAAMPSALGSFLAITIASLAYAIWVSSQVSVPANVQLAAAYFPMWFCITAPLIPAFSALVVTIADNTFREFQARPLPRGMPFVLGALIGLAFSVASASLALTSTCGPPELC